jgi:bifunctional DNase/RNase
MRKFFCHAVDRARIVSSGCLILTLVMLVALALGCYRHTTAVADNGVEVEVLRLAFDQTAGTPVVILREKAGERLLPIWIGEPEAQAILLKLHGIESPRPLTSDLLKSVLDKTGNRVDRVVINDLRDETFYATIYLDDARYRIDSRPSDAIALALACKVPIFVLPQLFVHQTPMPLEKPGVAPPRTHARRAGAIIALMTVNALARLGIAAVAS